jgi:hypothetical protein
MPNTSKSLSGHWGFDAQKSPEHTVLQRAQTPELLFQSARKLEACPIPVVVIGQVLAKVASPDLLEQLFFLLAHGFKLGKIVEGIQLYALGDQGVCFGQERLVFFMQLLRTGVAGAWSSKEQGNVQKGDAQHKIMLGSKSSRL